MAVDQVLSVGATPKELRVAVDSAIEAGDRASARLILQHLWAQHGGSAQAGFVTGRWLRAADPGVLAQPLRLMVLRSFTLEPVVPLVRAGGLLTGLDIDVTVGDFNTYARDLLDPASPLYGSAAPDAVVLAVHTRDIAPALWSGTVTDSETRRVVADETVDELCGLLTAFRERSSIPMIVHGLESPANLSLGIADRREQFGQHAAVEHMNRELESAAGEIADVHFLDWNALVASVGRREVSDERKWNTMRMPLGPAALSAVAQAWLRILHPVSGRLAKAIVVDLDNTMWGGVLGEEGVDGLALGAEGTGAAFTDLQRTLRALRERGILLAIASKNDHDEALAAIDRHPDMLLRSEDFHSARISWADKASGLREIAEELNIGLDALVFLDDNPAERLLIATELPDVAVLSVTSDPASLAAAVRGCPLFERLELTTEDRQRSDYYVQQRERTQSRTSATSLEDYLRSLGTSVNVGRASERELARVAQLTQKTNQFNMTTRRYTEQQIVDLAEHPSWSIYTLRASDRFGDHGLVAAALVELLPQRWRIDTFLMSCRVIGRDVETALVRSISEAARIADITELVGEFVPTTKNSPARDFYGRHGFSEQVPTTDVEAWVLDVNSTVIDLPEWITLAHDPPISSGAI